MRQYYTLSLDCESFALLFLSFSILFSICISCEWYNLVQSAHPILPSYYYMLKTNKPKEVVRTRNFQLEELKEKGNPESWLLRHQNFFFNIITSFYHWCMRSLAFSFEWHDVFCSPSLKKIQGFWTKKWLCSWTL